MYLRNRRIGSVGLAAVFALFVAGCDIAINSEGDSPFSASATAQDEWTRTYKLAAGGRLEIININGKISAEASDGPDVEIRAERSAKAASEDAAKELLGRLDMREEIGDSRARVEVRGPRNLGRSSHTVNWTIKIPKGIAVDLRTVNGGVILTRLEGDIRARATNGGVKGTGITATTVDAAVTNGGVEIDLAHAATTGTFELESVNGGVALSLPAESKADVIAKAVNGGIAVNGLTLEAIGDQTKRRVEGKLNGGGARISLETVNGGVRLSRTTT